MKALLVASIKDEGPNLLEWVAYHRVIGFDQILIYQNDSDDCTQDILCTLQDIGAIRWFDNPCHKRQWQNRAYRRASFSQEFSEADWCMALDGDEFLNVKVGMRKVQDLIQICSDPDEILVNWRIFGSGGHNTLSADPVIGRYLLTDDAKKVERGLYGFKSLFKTDAYKRPGIHKAKACQVAEPRRCNGSGIPLEDVTMAQWRSKDPGHRKYAQVNHYPLRDLSSFLLKSIRGSASHPDRDVSQKYWRQFNYSDALDDSILPLLLPTLKEMKRLDDASGGVLRQLQQKSLGLWSKKLERLLETPEGADLRRDLCDDMGRRLEAA